MKSLIAIVIAIMFLGCKSGDVGTKDWSEEELEPRIVANLKLQFPSLRDAELAVDSLRDSEVDGMLRGNLVLPGGERHGFLLDADAGTLYLLAAPPVDVNRDADDAMAAIESETGDLHRELMADVADFPARGAADAPVTIVEFSDFQCPYCGRAAGTVDQILSERADQVRLIYVHYPLPNHPWARPAAIASTCAARQSDDAFWLLHDQYFAEQRTITTANVVERSRAWLAQADDVDMQAWETCASDTTSSAHAEAAALVDRGKSIGDSVGVSGTPHFVINGRPLNGARPAADFNRAIDLALSETADPGD